MNSQIEIAFAETDRQIKDCYPVMSELRPHLTPGAFLEQVRRQIENHGFGLVYLSDAGVKAVAGIRIAEWLAGGRYLEIEDLATLKGERSRGHGGKLFDWLVDYAREHDCRQVRLVSHVTRFAAHRFYLNKRMNIEAHYFSMTVD